MRSLVVLFAVAAVAVATPQYIIQTPYSVAAGLDILGRPLEPAEVIAARALHYQAKAFGHVLKKRSIGHAVTYSVPSAVSHQSRVDVRTSPAVVASAPLVTRTVVAEPVVARAVYAPASTVYAGGSAVTHQSRVDVHSSPAVVTEQVVAPAVVDARSLWAPTVYASTW